MNARLPDDALERPDAAARRRRLAAAAAGDVAEPLDVDAAIRRRAGQPEAAA